jgi:RND family efflux transporter MFP subunit
VKDIRPENTALHPEGDGLLSTEESKEAARPPKKRNKQKIVLIIVGIILIAIIGIRFVQTFSPTPEEAPQLANVTTDVVRLGSLEAQSPLTGRVEPKEEVTILPSAGGEVTGVYVRLGDQVSKGDLLFTIDGAQIAASFNQAKASLDLAKRTLDNMRVLYSEGAVSQNDFEQSRVQYESALASYTTASEAYSNTRVTAPISGYVTSINVSQGSTAAPGSPAATLADVSSLRIRTTISEFLAGRIRQGDPVEIVISTIGTEPFQGTVDALSPAPAQGTLTYPVEFSIQDSEERIKAGMFAEIRIISDQRANVLMVPSKAVTIRNGEASVVVLKDKLPSFKPVTTGLDNGEWTEIISGLSEGEIIVVEGQQFVTENEEVNIISQ